MPKPFIDKQRPVEIRGESRRRFIKYSVALGALLGLDRWKVFEAVGRVGGNALADEISCSPTNRSVHVVAGNAGFAWFQLLWPHIDVAMANNPAFAFDNSFGPMSVAGTDQPLILSKYAPWKALPSTRQVSCFMGGTNEFTGSHIDNPTSSSLIDANSSKGLAAACATMQQANPTLVPVISVRNKTNSLVKTYGAFAGAPSIVDVATPDDIVSLFNSAASSALGPLATPQNAAWFEAYYKGFLSLSAAANRPTAAKSIHTGKIASNLVGVNLSTKLQPTPDDLMRYGLTLSTPTSVATFARTLIIAAKAFKLGLTSCIMLPAFNDDAHGAFADMTALANMCTAIGKILDAFLGDLAVDDPTCAGAKIADNLVMSFHTDTPKTPLIRANWPDPTPGNSNWVYALGAGWLKNGWFGGVHADGTVSGFDPTTGADMKGQPSSATSGPAAAAIAYAVAKGDKRRVEDFYRGADIGGITRLKIM